MRVLSFLLLTLLLSSGVSAYSAAGLSPPLKEYIYTSGATIEGAFSFFSDGEKNIRADVYGDLADYITLDNGERSKEMHVSSSILVPYTLRLPADLKPGTYRSEIIMSQFLTPEEKVEGGGGARAFAAVSHVIIVRAPNDGKYLEASITLEPARIAPGDVVYFTIPILNFGTEQLDNLKTEVVIRGPAGEIARRPTNTVATLAPAESAKLLAYWDTQGQSRGEYSAEAAILYGGKAPATVASSFRIGEIKIDILGIRSDVSGPVGKVFIDVGSSWNEAIPNVYAEVAVKQGSAEVTRIRTSAIDLQAWQNATLTAFWERETLPPGDYQLEVYVYYYDKRENQQVQVKLEELRKPSPLTNRSFVVLVIVLGILILLNAAWFLKRARKK